MNSVNRRTCRRLSRGLDKKTTWENRSQNEHQRSASTSRGTNRKMLVQWSKGKANLFAVGRYQLIPCTLQYATASIDDLDVRTMYEPEVQDAFGVFLLFVKRPVVGDYLLGEHNDFKEAGQELAKEFALCAHSVLQRQM